MDKEKAIREIVGSYDLTSNLKEKIIRIAVEKTDDLYINGFDDLYTYVATLVDKFKYFYSSKFLVKIDSPIEIGSKKDLHQIIGSEDNILINLFKDEELNLIYKDINSLKDTLNKKYLDILGQLINNSDENILLELSSYFSTNKTTKNINQLQERLEVLISKYIKDGKILIPKRPIVSIQFNPFDIKFKKRNYKGDPLLFFKENIDVYANMSKSELFLFDNGIYTALLRSEKLGEAIPYKYRGYDSPLEFFNAKKKYEGLTKTQLKKIDSGLYESLRLDGQLDKAIHIKKRLFRGCNSPLDYFKIKKNKYKNLSRTQLKEIDRNLYAALLRHKQLEEAIPYSLRKTLSREQIINIRKTLLKNRGLIKKTVRETGHSRQAVRKYGKVLSIFNNS